MNGEFETPYNQWLRGATVARLTPDQKVACSKSRRGQIDFLTKSNQEIDLKNWIAEFKNRIQRRHTRSKHAIPSEAWHCSTSRDCITSHDCIASHCIALPHIVLILFAFHHVVVASIFFLTQFLCQAICTQRTRRTQVIVGSMNMGYISDTARNRTHNLFRPKRELIPLGHSDGHTFVVNHHYGSLHNTYHRILYVIEVPMYI